MCKFYQMGYGTRALEQLQQYYEGKLTDLTAMDIAESAPAPKPSEGSLTDAIKPRRQLAPLLAKLSERRPEELHYLGVSFGLTPQLFNFWRRAGFLPVYLRLSEVQNPLLLSHFDSFQ